MEFHSLLHKFPAAVHCPAAKSSYLTVHHSETGAALLCSCLAGRDQFEIFILADYHIQPNKLLLLYSVLSLWYLKKGSACLCVFQAAKPYFPSSKSQPQYCNCFKHRTIDYQIENHLSYKSHTTDNISGVFSSNSIYNKETSSYLCSSNQPLSLKLRMDKRNNQNNVSNYKIQVPAALRLPRSDDETLFH